MMDSQLQIGLLGAGIVCVVLIFAYNRWQEHKHRKHAEQAFKSAHRDVLLDPHDENGVDENGRVEPQVAQVVMQDDAGEGYDPVMQAADAGPAILRKGREVKPVRRSAPDAPDVLDVRTDCWIRIEAIEPIDVSQIWTLQESQLAGLSKPVRWFVFDNAINVWRQINGQDTGRYDWFCVALQLVDRRGPLSESDFLRFCGGSQRVAEQFLAVPACMPVWNEVLEHAVALDRFCAEVDVQIGINVIAGSAPFSGTKLRGVAEAQGMVLGENGCFQACEDNGQVLFSMSNLEANIFSAATMRTLQTNGVTLVIDVPCVTHGIEAFDRMMRMAGTLADALHGRVVDDNRAAFGPEAATVIRGQIHQFQQRMSSENMPAGSELALRLFAG